MFVNSVLGLGSVFMELMFLLTSHASVAQIAFIIALYKLNPINNQKFDIIKIITRPHKFSNP